MRTSQTLVLLLAIGGLAGIAGAREGAFSVAVQVVDRRPASALLDAIPVPPQARIFDGQGHSRAYAWTGTPVEAAEFFELEMPARGYRALARSTSGPSLQQVWGDSGGRVVVQLDQALGPAGLTRIRISVGAAPLAQQPPRAGGGGGTAGRLGAP